MRERLVNFAKGLLSRKFLLTIAAVMIAYDAGIADGVISETELTMIIGPILAFVGVEGWRDAKAAGK